ncbi:GntR family transcriptional regulator [Aquibaculum arenosum]|uniref:GntR family transcriptional regulator n=1 Tax=Aquibaculum arenosum TaxID=3032591 RepID=A0ABT5YLH2_9PROT|nr:GntR family transcriptional regulator [Fodinicurvata sp. CAU 1616]MDF2095681.1 GntR family transcriptional regulator [Fodinicurvata sp. CAU 1616]
MAFQTIERHGLVDRVAEQLTRAIVTGRFVPGQRLGEAEIARQMGISRAPVREAARLLEQRGLLTSRPHRGFAVRLPTLEEVDDLYSLRLCLESFAGSALLARGADVDLDPLRRQLERLLETAERGDQAAVVEEDLRFHLLLCELSGNRRLQRVFSELTGELHLVIALVGQIFDDPCRLAQVHCPLLEALEAGDGERLQQELDNHITVAWKEVRALFQQRQQKPARPGEGEA